MASLTEEDASAANQAPLVEDSFDLGLLGDLLSRSGYGEFVACFDPLVPRPSLWRMYRAAAPSALKSFIALFLLNDPVAADTMPAPLRDLLPGLVASGLIVEGPDGMLMTPGVVILPILGNWLICQPPQPNPAFYFGEDSVALLMRILPHSGGDCLDLCAGPGIQALHSARFARHVTAVEVDPLTANLAQMNARLNRLADRLDVLQGDLYRPVAGRRFHTVIANPPLLPYPQGMPAPSIGDGGPDGLRITWRILEGLPQALHDPGTAHIVGMTLSDGRRPLAVDRLRALAQSTDLTIRLSVLSHKSLAPGSDYFEALAGTVALASGESETVTCDALRTMLAREGGSHLCTFFLHASRGGNRLALADLSDPERPGLWYVQGK